MMHFFFILSSFLQQSESVRLRDESVRVHRYDAYDYYGYDRYGYYGEGCENDDGCSFGLVCIEKQCIEKPATEKLDEINHSIRFQRLYEPKSTAEKKKMDEEDEKFKKCLEDHEEHEEERLEKEDEEKDWFNILAAGFRRRLAFEKEEWIQYTGDDIHLLLSGHPFLKSQVEKFLKVKNLRHYLQCNEKMSEDSNNWILTRLIFGGNIRAKHFQDKKGEFFMKALMGEDTKEMKKFHEALNSAYETYKAIEPVIHNPDLEHLKDFVGNKIDDIVNEFKDPDQMQVAIASWAHHFEKELTTEFIEEDLVGSLSFVTRFTVQRIIKNKIKQKLPKGSKLRDFAVDLFCDGFLKSIGQQFGESVVHHVLGHAAGHAAHGFLWGATHAMTHGVLGAVFGATITTALVHTVLVSLPLITLRYVIKYGAEKYCESVKDEYSQDNYWQKRLLCKLEDKEELTEEDRRELIEANEFNRASYVEIWKKSGFADNNDFENSIHDEQLDEALYSDFNNKAYHNGPYIYVRKDSEWERRWQAQQDRLKEKNWVAMDAFSGYFDHDWSFDIIGKGKEGKEIERQILKEDRAQFFSEHNLSTGEVQTHPGWNQGHWS